MRFPSSVLYPAFCLCLWGALVLAAGEALAQSAAAQAAGQEYFEALYDVPVMPGLEEVKDAAMVFDKPDGRIASAMAVSRSLPPQAVQRFYEEVLPQMGWRKLNLNQYVRDKMQLTLDVGGKSGQTIAYFTLSPRAS